MSGHSWLGSRFNDPACIWHASAGMGHTLSHWYHWHNTKYYEHKSYANGAQSGPMSITRGRGEIGLASVVFWHLRGRFHINHGGRNGYVP
jgi:hypothetical protein